MTRLQQRRDARAALLGELVRGVCVLKCYGGEGAWAARVSEARSAELRELRLLNYLGAAISLVCGLLSQAAPVAIFGWYVLVQRQALSAPVAFTALAWIDQMRCTPCAAAPA